MVVKLSVIVACYNIQEYVEDCLNSVCEQAKCDVEVIVVNDGSTDGTISVINNVINRNPAVRWNLINKKNSGVSDARNAGIAIASGEFITFLDGDDIWAENYIESIYDDLNEKNDIIEFDAFRFLTNIYNRESYFEISPQVVTNNINRNNINRFKKNQWLPWSRIYKRSLINDKFFPKGKRFEDIYSIPQVYFKSKAIVTIKKPLVGYRVNPDSITNNTTVSDIFDIVDALEYNSDLAKNENEKLLVSLMTVGVSPVINIIFNRLLDNELKHEAHKALGCYLRVVYKNTNIKNVFSYKPKTLIYIAIIFFKYILSEK